jgi:hypothetical protein
MSIVASSDKHTSYVDCTNLETDSVCRKLPQSDVNNNIATAIPRAKSGVRRCGVVLSLGRALCLMRCGDRAVDRQPSPRWPASPLQLAVKAEAFQECEGFGFN